MGCGKLSPYDEESLIVYLAFIMVFILALRANVVESAFLGEVVFA